MVDRSVFGTKACGREVLDATNAANRVGFSRVDKVIVGRVLLLTT